MVFDPAKRYTMPKVPKKPPINIVEYLDAPLWSEEFAGLWENEAPDLVGISFSNWYHGKKKCKKIH
jgi:hypothetical protein